jgi:Carboxypeptidase regulatory-like domain
MRSSLLGWLIMLGASLALPVTGYAQDAVISGTVTDSTGAVLPGVTVTAVHEAAGNTFQAVTDAGGSFRMPARTGVYKIVAELSGFASVTRSGLELLVGQQAVVNLQMVPSGVQESVTVTGEAPLIETTQSSLGGNVDPRQMQELPLNGRNWQDLTLMAAGSRNNAVADNQPTPLERRDYQINVDGQQVTQNIASGGGVGNPMFSRDAIAEFQLIANRFDATQGRSSGVQVNAITKSGTNTPAGTFSGYFRDDRFNSADFIRGIVLPYGGPLRRDRVHLFVNYEYEREPQTYTFNTPYPRFNFDLSATRTQRMGGVRLDLQLSPQTRLMTRANMGGDERPIDNPPASAHPSAAGLFERHMDEIYTTLTQVLGNQAVNEIKAGYASHYYFNQSIVDWPNHPQAFQGFTHGTPRINFVGFSIGQNNVNWPQRLGQNYWSIRDDFTYSFTKGGRHDLKLGGEYLFLNAFTSNCRECGGVIDVQGGPIPGNIEDLFPVWNDVSTWNLAALSPITRRYQQTVGKLPTNQTRHAYAAWVQDDWAIRPRLTLNLGLRYDLFLNAFANDIALPPFLEAGRPDDTNNIGPRLGLAYSLNDRTVLRGGFGVYYGDVLNNQSSRTESWLQLAGIEVPNDGRPDFAANPFNGPFPTFDEAYARYCSSRNVPGCLRRNINQMVDPTAQVPYSYQTSIGMQRQLGDTMAVEADYAFTGGRHEYHGTELVNLSYDPVTGVNYPFTDISRRPYPEFGNLGIERMAGWSNYHGLQTAFTKRMRNRWQAAGTYTLAGFWDAEALPLSGLQQVTFKVAPDLGGEYTLGVSDQRHRAVVNGIWQVGYGFQLSGLYFFGSGARFTTNYGGDRRNTGGTNGRLRPDGTIVPRNNFVGAPLHRVDLRIQRRFRLRGRAGIDGILEVFNLFNHENYGSYTTAESNSLYGKPSQNTNVAYQPRMVQLGFRATF